jgi:Cys-rich protein (TIGR01571 family)
VSPFILNGGNGAEPQRHQGGWKDDLWDCFRFGPCHATVWNALCCPQLLMAQVLTRMKMNWLGEEAPAHEYKRTFGRVFLIVCLYWLLTTLSWPPSSTFIQDPESGKVMRIPPDEVPAAQNLLFNLVLQSFGLYTLLMIIKLRRTVRLRYEIPLQYPLFGNGKMEDFCLAFWCGCCSLSQMARHTCDYEQQSATFCSPDGLKRSQHSPVLVV